ncbi:MAG: NAD(P)-dependent glycerol-3-phosphate dehydrogenase [Candidatus Omnitrophica bacterium]|nr:NAD(P)-dependent glycerol-3-phosphate dehydrogenase [Candidatus Omnitrophota bacterium]
MVETKKITVLGDGGWGTALAVELGRRGVAVCLWGYFKDYIELVSKGRENTKFLKGIKIPKSVFITSDLKEALIETDVVILAVPSEYLRAVLESVKTYRHGSPIYVSVAKGIEPGVLMRMSEVVQDVLGKDENIVALSGPTIAIEVARGMPTTAVAASLDIERAKEIQKLFTSERFRVYTSSDLIGVELGGALKNIVAIAAGISDALGFGTNTKAAILTRGLAEITRLGITMGARVETFAGLSGIGDLVTTCISSYSRNRWFGEMLGKGKSAKEILAGTEMAIEGVITAKSAYELSKEYGVEMPIATEIYNVIYMSKSPKDVVGDLMLRTPKPEVY